MNRFNLLPVFLKLGAISLIFLFLCLGCRVGPDYNKPATEVPDEWKTSQKTPVITPCVDYWWEVFDDDTLNRLELQAIENNPNLEEALYSVFEARAIALVQEAALFPQFNIDPSYSNQDTLFLFPLPSNLSTAIPGLPTGPTVFRFHQQQYVLPFDMSYEIDLWGKLRSQYESATMNAEAQEEAYNTTLLTLTADLATDYFQLRSLDAQIELYKKTIESLNTEYNLTNARFNKGIVTYLDVANALTQLRNAQSTYEDLIRQRALQENAIAVLIGTLPSDFSLGPMPLKGTPPAIPAGVPSAIIIKRPDIAEAERDMASQHALINAAYANFLPSLTLTGILGFSSPDIKDFLRWKSRYWLMGANSSQMVFDGGRDEANLAATWAQFMETSSAYQQVVLNAFQEVEDALSNLETQAKQAEYLKESSKAADKGYSLSLDRYNRGIVTYLEVMVNLRTALSTDQSYIIVQGQRFVSTIQLIKALGGSWE